MNTAGDCCPCCVTGEVGRGRTAYNTGLPAPVTSFLPPNLRPVMPFACANVLPRLQVRQPETLYENCGNIKGGPSWAALKSKSAPEGSIADGRVLIGSGDKEPLKQPPSPPSMRHVGSGTAACMAPGLVGARSLNGAFRRELIELHLRLGLEDLGDLKHGKTLFVLRSKIRETTGAKLRQNLLPHVVFEG